MVIVPPLLLLRLDLLKLVQIFALLLVTVSQSQITKNFSWMTVINLSLTIVFSVSVSTKKAKAACLWALGSCRHFVELGGSFCSHLLHFDLFLSLSPAIGDSTSLMILLDELRLLYQQAEGEREFSLLPLDFDYKSFLK